MANKPTAAIYNRWLHTLGGGEQMTLSFFESLRSFGYQTVLLTHRFVDSNKISEKFNIKIAAEEIVFIDDLSDEELSAESGKYDVFINTSHLDYFPNQSKKGLLNVYFPSPMKVSGYEYAKRKWLIPFLQQTLSYVSLIEQRDNQLRIRFNKPVSAVKVSLHFPKVNSETIERTTCLANNSEPVLSSFDVKHNNVIFFYRKPTLPIKQLTINLPPNTEYRIQYTTIDDWSFIAHQLFKKILPTQEIRLHGGPKIFTRQDIESYHAVTSISQFSKEWMKKYWGIESEILYPAVNIENFAPAKHKTNSIVHIGRFFQTGHNKKQLELVQEFRKLVDSGVREWEFHLIGSIADGEVHHEYVRQIQDLAKGYPITFHLNASFTELKKLLSEAKIYWHATGLDFAQESDPSKMEHFGITTVEAMASGAVPVVINKGGQPEIVTPESGFVWEDRDELIACTKKLIEDEELRKKMSAAAIERSTYFSKAKFTNRLTDILASIK